MVSILLNSRQEVIQWLVILIISFSEVQLHVDQDCLEHFFLTKRCIRKCFHKTSVWKAYKAPNEMPSTCIL